MGAHFRAWTFCTFPVCSSRQLPLGYKTQKNQLLRPGGASLLNQVSRTPPESVDTLVDTQANFLLKCHHSVENKADL